MSNAVILLIVLAFALPFRPATGSQGVPNGWSRSDRFLGFRYQLKLLNGAERPAVDVIMKRIQRTADRLFCFGWVQSSVVSPGIDTLVGEARCKKQAGEEMKSFLLSMAKEDDWDAGENIIFRDYPSTIIRLHFSSFKIVSPGRNTCFRDYPHKCDHLYSETT